MVPLTRAAVASLAVLMALPSVGCFQDLNHRDYCELQSHVQSSTGVLQKLGVSVPWEYALTMLQRPDYEVAYAELSAFLARTGDSAFQQTLEGRIRGTDNAQGGEAADGDKVRALPGCTVMFYDEAAHFNKPLSSCMGFVACWYLVAPDGKIRNAGLCHSEALLRRAGAPLKH